MACTGYRPFVEACIDAGEKDEALKYIPKLSDPKEKAEVNHYQHKYGIKMQIII